MKPFSMTLKGWKWILVLKEQFIDKSGKTRMLYASWVSKSSKTTLKEMLNEPAYFTIITEPIHPYVCQLNKIKIKMKIYVDH